MPLYLTSNDISSPGFWAAYLLRSLTPEGMDMRQAAALFGLTEAQVEAAFTALFGPWDYETRWTEGPDEEAEPIPFSLLRLPLPDDLTWEIRFFGEDAGCYHYLLDTDSPSTADAPVAGLLLGYDDPHAHLPILRWAEVVPLVGVVAQGASALSAAAVLLLLLPVAWREPADVPAARTAVAAACQQVGISPSAKLLDALTWAVPDLHWSRDTQGRWTTDSPYSHRRPGYWAPDESDLLARALVAAGA